jgi:hypothetical protein
MTILYFIGFKNGVLFSNLIENRRRTPLHERSRVRFLLKLSKKHPCANISKGVEPSAIDDHGDRLSDEMGGLCCFVRGSFELPFRMEYQLIH